MLGLNPRASGTVAELPRIPRDQTSASDDPEPSKLQDIPVQADVNAATGGVFPVGTVYARCSTAGELP